MLHALPISYIFHIMRPK